MLSRLRCRVVEGCGREVDEVESGEGGGVRVTGLTWIFGFISIFISFPFRSMLDLLQNLARELLSSSSLLVLHFLFFASTVS